MNRIQKTLAAFAVMLAVMISGCSSDNGTGEEPDSGKSTESRGEHDRNGRVEHDRDGSEHGEEGEESGAELALNETYDKVRNGARLILAYDAQSNSFNGTVENTTDETLKRVRVEVHLSNGKELGPTTPTDLNPGEKRDVKLTATSKDFNGWTAHPEVGSGEHGGTEGSGEHDSGEGRGEHDREGRGEHR
ncbi:FxLYD domain-containing protein [Planctomycetota bacterium]